MADGNLEQSGKGNERLAAWTTELFRFGDPFRGSRDEAVSLLRQRHFLEQDRWACRDLLAAVAPGRKLARATGRQIEDWVAHALTRDLVRLVIPQPVEVPSPQRRRRPDPGPTASGSASDNSYRPADNAELDLSADGGDEVGLTVGVEAEEPPAVGADVNHDPPPGVAGEATVVAKR
ncbi:MAG: hypothetical protein U0527_07725 [Candidatus Eisenbacteria bacterium]